MIAPEGTQPSGAFLCYFFLVSAVERDSICLRTAYNCDSRLAMFSLTRARFFWMRDSRDCQCLSSDAFVSVMSRSPMYRIGTVQYYWYSRV